MSDWIERQAAIDALDCINGVEEVLRSLPSVQPEIIRCRECIYFGYYECKIHGNNWHRSGDGFCDRAERKEDG